MHDVACASLAWLCLAVLQQQTHVCCLMIAVSLSIMALSRTKLDTHTLMCAGHNTAACLAWLLFTCVHYTALQCWGCIDTICPDVTYTVNDKYQSLDDSLLVKATLQAVCQCAIVIKVVQHTHDLLCTLQTTKNISLIAAIILGACNHVRLSFSQFSTCSYLVLCFACLVTPAW